MSELAGHKITIERVEETDSRGYQLVCECGDWVHEVRPVNLTTLQAGTDAGLAHILDVVNRDGWTPA